ncbi:MAG: extracellular solute-binding protein [Lachnospiraceae bacterium]|nr:extracellular solute-binding protein [Lachnospiraceae bacterium]
MKKSKKALALLMATAMTASLAACGSKENDNNGASATPAPGSDGNREKVSLRVWAPENQIQTGTVDAMFKSFEALHPEWEIEFKVEAQGEDNCKDAVLKDVGAAGDVYFFASDQLQELVNAGAIARLGGSAEKLVKETIAESVQATVTAEDGNIYAIPFTHNTFFMYYDKTLLSDDDITSMEKIMAKQTADNVYNFYFESAGGWKLGCWYYGAGLTIYGESQNDYSAGVNWNNDTGVAVTNYLIDLIGNPKCAFDGDITVSELAADHRIGAWFDGAWNYNMYKDALGDNLGMAKIPTFNPDGKDYQLKGFYSSKAVGVNPQAKSPKVAVAFAEFICNQENQVKRYKETAQIPTNITAGNSAEVQADPLAKVIVDESNNASVMQPTNANFSAKYWTNAGAIATEIRSGALNKNNVKEKLNAFCDSMKVE